MVGSSSWEQAFDLFLNLVYQLYRKNFTNEKGGF